MRFEFNTNIDKPKSYTQHGMEKTKLALSEREDAVRALKDALEEAFEKMPKEKVDEIYDNVKRNNEAGRAVEH